MGALVVGLAAAKALAFALDKPLYGVNHLAGHVAVDLVEHGPLPQPCLALLVSGGHTSLLQVDDVARSITELGSTIDDAAGEAYDKVARLLSLPYPGGPHIDRAAADGDPTAIAFPRGLTARRDLERHRFDFSFSGLKTAVARYVETAEAEGRDVPTADVAASFQEAVCDVLSAKAMDACAATGADRSADRRRGGGQPAAARAAGRAGGRGRHPAADAAARAVHRQRRHDRRPRRRGGDRRDRALAAGHRRGLARCRSVASACDADPRRHCWPPPSASRRWRPRPPRPDPDSLAAATALRSRFPPDVAAAALTQIGLRRSARTKLGERADSMLFTRAGLEQASRAAVAAHHADRFVAAGVHRVVDLGCGIGADALALLDAGLEVVAVDADPETASIARANLGDRAEVLVGDAVELAPTLLGGPGVAAFADPARRTSRGRSWRMEDLSPPWSLRRDVAGR